MTDDSLSESGKLEPGYRKLEPGTWKLKQEFPPPADCIRGRVYYNSEQVFEEPR